MHSICRVSGWTKLPGNWDTLHFSQVFPSDNDYGIPTIADNATMPSRLLQWGSRPQLLSVPPESQSAVHFFLDDFRFESLWHTPTRNLDALLSIGCVLSPDFSLWRDMPVAMQLWQTYRNRWLGCFWQSCGLSVIPTISWSQPHDFCYMGVTPGSIVALSSVGVVSGDALARRLFREGLEKMIEVIRPAAILCYGPLDMPGLTIDTPVVTFPTRWQEHRRALRLLRQAPQLHLWEDIA